VSCPVAPNSLQRRYSRCRNYESHCTDARIPFSRLREDKSKDKLRVLSRRTVDFHLKQVISWLLPVGYLAALVFYMLRTASRGIGIWHLVFIASKHPKLSYFVLATGSYIASQSWLIFYTRCVVDRRLLAQVRHLHQGLWARWPHNISVIIFYTCEIYQKCRHLSSFIHTLRF